VNGQVLIEKGGHGGQAYIRPAVAQAIGTLRRQSEIKVEQIPLRAV
jgi:hypothetical protein